MSFNSSSNHYEIVEEISSDFNREETHESSSSSSSSSEVHPNSSSFSSVPATAGSSTSTFASNNGSLMATMFTESHAEGDDSMVGASSSQSTRTTPTNSHLTTTATTTTTTTTISNNNHSSTNENDASMATAKRRAIQTILKNSSLTDLEKRLEIQGLMDGRLTNTSNSSILNRMSQNMGKLRFASGMAVLDRMGSSNHSSRTGGSTTRVEEVMSNTSTTTAIPNCKHYERKCNVVAPCCGKVFGCRICHDDSMQLSCGAMDRFAITEIVCKECHTRQPKSNKCIQCSIQFAEHYCSICNIWMSLAKAPFHCDQCGLCRVGGESNFKHCHKCCMCISINIFDDHNCLKDKYKNNCPVCREDMFSSRQSPQDLPCGHAIHSHCFRKLAGFDYRCPICKKTAVAQEFMARAWSERAKDIAEQPMPSDLARIVSIICNDCEDKTDNLSWHFLGVQCPKCDSFNTALNQNAIAATVDPETHAQDRC